MEISYFSIVVDLLYFCMRLFKENILHFKLSVFEIFWFIFLVGISILDFLDNVVQDTRQSRNQEYKHTVTYSDNYLSVTFLNPIKLGTLSTELFNFKKSLLLWYCMSCMSFKFMLLEISTSILTGLQILCSLKFWS